MRDTAKLLQLSLLSTVRLFKQTYSMRHWQSPDMPMVVSCLYLTFSTEKGAYKRIFRSRPMIAIVFTQRGPNKALEPISCNLTLWQSLFPHCFLHVTCIASPIHSWHYLPRGTCWISLWLRGKTYPSHCRKATPFHHISFSPLQVLWFGESSPV